MRTLTVNVDPPLEPAIGSFSGTTPHCRGRDGDPALDNNQRRVGHAIEAAQGRDRPDSSGSDARERHGGGDAGSWDDDSTRSPRPVPLTTNAGDRDDDRDDDRDSESGAAGRDHLVRGADRFRRLRLRCGPALDNDQRRGWSTIVADPVPERRPVPTISEDQMVASGLVTVNPIVDTTYTLTAMGGGEDASDRDQVCGRYRGC